MQNGFLRGLHGIGGKMFKYSVLMKNEFHLEDQLDICKQLGFSNMEITETINNIHFLDIKNEDIIKLMYKNKIFISMLNVKAQGVENHLPYYKRLVQKCSSLGIELINISGLQIVNADLNEILNYSYLYKVGICIENNYDSAFNSNMDYAEIFTIIKRSLGIVFNPLEFVKNKEHPFLNVFYRARFKNSIKVLRINDGLFKDASLQMPGNGNCEIKELLSALKSRSFNGYISFIPYFPDQTIEDYRMIYKSFYEMAINM
jgi:sugar phosphate isomerase/epimerase